MKASQNLSEAFSILKKENHELKSNIIGFQAFVRSLSKKNMKMKTSFLTSLTQGREEVFFTMV